MRRDELYGSAPIVIDGDPGLPTSVIYLRLLGAAVEGPQLLHGFGSPAIGVLAASVAHVLELQNIRNFLRCAAWASRSAASGLSRRCGEWGSRLSTGERILRCVEKYTRHIRIYEAALVFSGSKSNLGDGHHLHPMARGILSLTAVIDWFTRRVLTWRLSISMEVAHVTNCFRSDRAPTSTPAFNQLYLFVSIPHNTITRGGRSS
ncbi:hypothetical protein SAMN05444161_7468 [Rhizobiales bacterium GAS191]|nr:hypothetical protein SAMN05444161_7468 [Rhizobiales bacterium GAS191]